MKKTLNRPELSENVIVSTPEVNKMELNKNGTLIMACDGVFDKLSNDQVAKHCIQSKVLDGRSSQQVAEDICKLALEHKTKDNVSVLVVFFD